MSAMILEGPAVANAITDDVASRASALRDHGVRPKLAVVRVGERPDDISYERGLAKRAEKAGVAVEAHALAEGATQEELLDVLDALGEDASVHGILLFRPLPQHMDEEAIMERIPEVKDVDSCRNSSLASVFSGKEGFAPCTAQACIEILDHYGISVEGKEAVVVGRSLVIGKPVAMMLLARNATVTIAHSKTVDLKSIVRRADIVVACVGSAEMIDESYLAPGQVVLDVGINFTDDGKMVGDVAFSGAEAKVSAITPVPRGVGAVTTSVLCKHVVEAAERAASKQ